MKGKTVAKIIAYVLVALLLIAVVGLIYKFTNGFNEDFKTFYVEYGGKQILIENSKMTLETDETHCFQIRYTFDGQKSEPKDYSVTIIPNVTRDFDYIVNGERYLYSKTGELTSAFGLKKEQSQFTVDVPAGFGLQQVLKSVYSGKSVDVPSDAETNNPYPYRLVISSYNGKVTYNIDFAVAGSRVTGVTLNPSEIVFGGEQSGTPEPPEERSYNVEYLLSGDATNLSSDLDIDGATQAKAGDTVTYSVIIGDENYSVSGMRISVMNSDETVEITESDGCYSFTMPQGNVYVWIYFEYTPPQDVTVYSLEYDSLGWASMEVINLDCPDKAAAGESVTFTATVKSEYTSEYKISRIVAQFGSGEDYIGDLQGNNGTYTFTMPDAATLEANEGYLTLMFYIIPVDM